MGEPINIFDKFKLGAMAADVRDGLELYLPDSATEVKIILESTAVSTLAMTTLGALPYVGMASELRIYDVCHFLTVRAGYFETALICAASAVHNIVMTMFYLGLFVVLFGQNQRINYSLQKHWYHSFYSTVGVGIGLVGTVVPILGVAATKVSLEYLWNRVTYNFKRDLEYFEDPLIRLIKEIYSNNHEQLVISVQALIRNEHRFGLIHPFLKGFSEGLPAVTTLNQLIELVMKTLRECSNTIPKSPSTPTTTS